jgi:DNA repair protein RecN (Recombination protein N)
LRLVELHGQHEHHALLDPLTHLPLVDAYADLGGLTARVGAAWVGVRGLREQLERSRMDGRERAARLELVTFQLGEIAKTAPRPGEDDELAATRQVLASAERIQRLCSEGYGMLYDGEHAALASLGAVWKRVAELASIDPQFSAYLDARDAIKPQLEDLAAHLRSYADGVDASPERLQQVEDRLAAIERLKRKYGPGLAGVIQKGEELTRERTLLSNDGDTAEEVQRALEGATGRFLELARDLSARRRRAAPAFAREMEALLASLAMSRTRFDVRFAPELPEADWGERGIDRAEFYVSPNPGEDLRPLARIASGGELSRVMLAVKTLAAEESPGKTLIFDEVDVGIGGRVSDVVGSRLRDLGDRFQVLCITHLPQIAARGTTHFRIEKTVRGNRTVTSVEALDATGRTEELARMIGGEMVSDAVRASARDMLAVSAGAGQGRTRPLRAKDKRASKGESESRRRV